MKWIFAPALVACAVLGARAATDPAPGFRIQLDTPIRGYDGKTCWVHPRAGSIPGETPSVVLTMQKLMLTGSDVFFALNEMRSDDFGKTWSGPTEHAATLGRRKESNGVIVFKDRYYLTLRNDSAGYVATSPDGLRFDEPRRWLWDDGADLGNYNTQQHWVTHSDGLFLVYTRKGATNDHVFRHRAPLFIAQVDPGKLQVIRSTERVLVPERGARLGNFGVTEVNQHETWVTVAEWMQTWPPNVVIPPGNPRGADNSVYAARILWTKPNGDWNKH